MRYLLSLMLAAVVLLGASLAWAQSAYDDVPRDHWAYNALDYLTERGVLEGYPDGFFKGDRTLTRYEFAQAVARLLDTIDGGGGDENVRIMADGLRTEFSDQLAELGRTVNDLGAHVNNLDSQVSGLESSVADQGAKIKGLEDKIAGMKPGPEWKGELRLRYQYESQGDSDRFRQRLRFRLGYNKKINELTEIGFRLETQTGNDKLSGNWTLGQDNGNTADIFLDRAYVKYSPTIFGWYNIYDCEKVDCKPRLDIYAGIYPNITYDPNEMINKEDINFHGIGAVYHFNQDFQILTAMSIAVEKNTGEAFDDDATFYATELRHTNLFTCGLDAWVGCYGWKNESALADGEFIWNRFDGFDFNNDGEVNTGGDRFSENFNTVKGGLQYTFNCVWNKPLAVWGEYMINVDSDAEERINQVNGLITPQIIYESSDDIGWGTGVQWGEKPAAKGDWYWFALYREIGANAIVSGYGHSDGGLANTNTLKVGAALMWMENSTIGLTYWLNKMHNAFGFQIPGKKEDQSIWQLDWNFKF
jgi:hypothetical protein